MDRRIKRIIFIGGYTPGDASSNFVVSFCKGYAELGLHVILLLQLDRIDYLPEISGVEIHIIERKQKRIGPLNLSRFLRERQISKLINRYYIMGETAIQYYGSPMYGWLFHHKKYLTVHTIGEVPFANPQAPFSYKVREWMQRLSTKRATGLLVQTEYLKDYFEKFGIKKVCVFNTLIDPNRFANLIKEIKHRYVSYCGKVGVYKDGVNDLIEAFAIVHREFPDVILQIVGDYASKKDEQVLKEMVSSLHLNDYVVFTGRVAPKEMPGILYNSEVLALARPNNRQAKYGFPSKLGEYLFSGNPVVVTRVGEIGKFLTDMKNCVFAEPDNPKDFSSKLNWVLGHPEEGREIGKRGKEVAMQNFSVLSQCRVALDFFDSLATK